MNHRALLNCLICVNTRAYVTFDLEVFLTPPGATAFHGPRLWHLITVRDLTFIKWASWIGYGCIRTSAVLYDLILIKWMLLICRMHLMAAAIRLLKMQNAIWRSRIRGVALRNKVGLLMIHWRMTILLLWNCRVSCRLRPRRTGELDWLLLRISIGVQVGNPLMWA